MRCSGHAASPGTLRKKKRKVGKRLFPLYELILAESRLNSFRLVSFPKFYFWVKLSKRCARIPFLLTHSYYQSFGLIPLDTYNCSSFHFWSKHPALIRRIPGKQISPPNQKKKNIYIYIYVNTLKTKFVQICSAISSRFSIGHGVRDQIAISKQRSRGRRDLGWKATDVDPRRICTSAKGKIPMQLDCLSTSNPSFNPMHSRTTK